MYGMYRRVEVDGLNLATGWLPPMPDLRDYTEKTPKVTEITKKLFKVGQLKLATKVDLRQWCSPIENQGGIGSCTANAAVGIVEYFERRAFGHHLEGSRLFVYKTTRNLLGVTGDTGAWLRNTMGALALCGVPDERYWPYHEADFDVEPPSFVYAIADNYEAVRYFCHDPIGAGRTPASILASVKKYLAAGIPSMFGFYGFPSFSEGDPEGGIPVPGPNEQAQWGHAIVAVGYDDKQKVKNKSTNKSSTGAFLIRNSWGKGWGDRGYGWLPYEYVTNGHALDFWSLIQMGWVDSRNFGL